MKTMLVVLSLSLASFGAAAQASTSNATSSTSASAGVNAAGNSQGVTFNSDNSGSSSLKTVPAVGAAAFYGSFSTDSCMVSGGAGGAVLGFGMNFAVPVEDQNCSLRRNFERTMQAAASTKDDSKARKLETAAIDMLCQTDDATRAALSAQGLCSDLTPVAVVPSVRRQVPVNAAAARARIDDLYTPG